jgi:hypothetical protein
LIADGQAASTRGSAIGRIYHQLHHKVGGVDASLLSADGHGSACVGYVYRRKSGSDFYQEFE